MYKAKLWEEDKWNIHEGYKSSKYGSVLPSDKKEGKPYHEQKYGSSEKNPSSDYMRKEDAKEKEENKKDSLFEELEEEEKKNKEDPKEEGVQFKAARQIFAEHRNEAKKEAEKNDKSTIEDAIKKAIEEEKKVIVTDN